MRKLALLLLMMLMVSLCAVFAAQGKTPYMPAEELKAEAERGFGEILDLWRDAKYDELYDRTMAGGKQTKEAFIGRIAAAPCRPACCWEKLQEVRVTIKSDDTVVIRAKVGLEERVATSTSTKTRDFKLAKEDGLWRISQADILFLSGAAKAKKKGHHAKRKKKVYYLRSAS